ncbi:hypothetical protein M758_4G240700 [Ceratodon purpureus]|nr:hypothetical protein M758_4G240700 [Ceratodon purpureus]
MCGGGGGERGDRSASDGDDGDDDYAESVMVVMMVVGSCNCKCSVLVLVGVRWCLCVGVRVCVCVLGVSEAWSRNHWRCAHVRAIQRSAALLCLCPRPDERTDDWMDGWTRSFVSAREESNEFNIIFYEILIF